MLNHGIHKGMIIIFIASKNILQHKKQKPKTDQLF